MKSRTSLFNPTIFRSFLKRYWLMWLFYGGLLIATFCLPLLNALQNYVRYAPAWYGGMNPGAELLNNLGGFSVIINLMCCGIIAAISFSYLYNTRHTGMMNSLPIRRETLFVTVLLADLAGLLLADVVMVLICLAMEAAFGMVNAYALGVTLLVLVLENVAFMGFAVVCCMLTGNAFAGPIVYLILNFTAPAVEFMGRYLLSTLQFGSTGAIVDLTEWLSPPYYIMMSLRRIPVDGVEGAYYMSGVGSLAAYALAGVVFMALALVLYRKRRMETAGDVVAIEILKPVFKACASLAGALCLASLVKESLYNVQFYGAKALIYLCVLMIVGGVIGWFIAQMLVEKTIHVFNHGWKGIGLMSLCFILFLTAGYFDWYGYERRVPELDEVREAFVSTFGAERVSTDDPETIQAFIDLHESIIANKQTHLDAEMNYGARQFVNILYDLENGKTIHRNYYVASGEAAYLDTDSDLWKLEAAVNTPASIRGRYVMPVPITPANVTECVIHYTDAETMEQWQEYYDLTPAEMAEFYNECILPDIADGDLGYINLVENDEYAQYKYDCYIRMEFRWPAEEETPSVGPGYRMEMNGVEYYCSYFTLYLTRTAERTVQFLNDRGIYPATVLEVARSQGGDYTPSGHVYPDPDSGNYSNDVIDEIIYRHG